MKDKCVIKSADKPCGNCLVRLSPAVHQRVQELALRTSRSIRKTGGYISRREQ